MKTKRKSTLIERLEARQLLSAAINWSSRGPGGGGAFFSPSFSPFNSNELYVTSDMSGLYHTTNLGQSWSVADFRQIQGGIGSQVQFTSNPNILYTLDYSDTAGGGSSTNVSRSANAGQTWAPVAGWNGSNNGAFSVFADPQNTTSLLVTDYGNLYFSGNSGQTFAKVYTDPSAGQGCYVGGVFWDGNNIYVGTDSGLVTSSNGGQSFSSAGIGGLPAGSSILSFAGAKQNGVTRLVAITCNSGDVFNGLETSSPGPGSFSGVWTLTPGQANWTKSTTVPASDGPLIVSMSLNDISDIYLGGTNYSTSAPIVAKSTDGGQTFSDVLNVNNNGNVATGWQGAGGDRQWSFDQLTLGFQVSPANPNEIAFTGDGFLHLSTDGGATWHQAYVNPAGQNPAGAATPQHHPYQGVGLEDTSTLALAWANQSTIVAGYTDINGVRSTDGGTTWSFPTGITLAGNTVYSIVKQGNTLYAATSTTHDIYQSTHVTDASINGGNGSILFSTDSGATWQTLHSFGHPVIWVATDPANANRLYASVVNSATGGIFVTNNLNAGVGATWTALAAPPRTQGHPFNINVLNDGTIVATYSGRRLNNTFTDSSGVFVSTDGGQTWLDRTGVGMHWWTKDITIDPTDPTQNTWYASVRFAYGTAGASSTGGLYRSTDRGQTWTQIFQSIGAESAAVNPTTGEMYLSTEENGLYYSANPKAAQPVFTQTTYPFRQPERIYFNPFNANEVWVTSFGYGLAVGSTVANPNTGSISGTVYNDVNSNGSQDPNDAGLTGVTVYIDANQDGQLDNNEVSTVTDAGGNYSFANLAAGTYRIAQVLPAGDTLTAPAAGFYSLTLNAGQALTAENFGDHQPAAATGTIFGDVYVDANGNGAEDPGETYLSGIQVYIDANHNGQLDAGETVVTSTPAGTYTFSNLAPGNYRVREVVPSGYTLTQPSAGFYDVALAAGQNVDDDLGNQPVAGVGIIRGSIFNDLNSDGIQNSGEPYLQGWTAYLDLNHDGQLDAGDPTAVTDSTGYFTFQGVAPGTYRVREVVQSGWTMTRPTAGFYDVTLAPGQTINDRIFGDHATPTTAIIAGIVFNDLNADGTQNSGEPNLQGWTVYLDTNLNGQLDAGEPSMVTTTTGGFVFQNLAPGNYRIREVVQSGWSITKPTTGFYDVSLAAGQGFTSAIFGDHHTETVTTGTIGGIVFNDLNADGTQNSGEPNLQGWTVYLDTNLNGQLDAGEPSMVTTTTGGFVFQNLAPGNYRIREVVQSGWSITKPTTGFYDVSLAAGQGFTGAIFGDHHTETVTTGTIGGIVFNDLNADGTQNSGEPNLQGWTVYLDTNLNGQLDAGEPSTLTTSTGTFVFQNLAPGNYRIREVVQSGWTITKPTTGFYDVGVAAGQGFTSAIFGDHHTETATTGTIGGTVFNDLSADGAQNSGEPNLQGWTVYLDTNLNGQLDAGEPSAVTTSTGTFIFQNLAPGNYRVREVVQSGWTITKPTTGFYDVSLAAGQGFTSANFGDHHTETVTTGTIGGIVFNDLNADGTQNSGEPNLPGWTVYLDTNLNGQLDAGEPSTVTTSTGAFVFPNLAPGNYRIREVVQSGWTITKPTSGFYDVTLAAGQGITSAVFGDHHTEILRTGSIAGNVFNDLNANAVKNDGEPGLAGWVVFLDASRNGKLDTGEISATTDVKGNYLFNNIAPGTYHVAEVLKTGWRRTTPGTTYPDVTVGTGLAAVGTTFGDTELGIIYGSVFNDVNGNGVKDAGEAGLGGFRVYLDLNHNGAWDSTEPSMITNASGGFAFLVAPGTYVVRVVPRTGYAATTGALTVTLGSGAVVSGKLFGEKPVTGVSHA